MLAQGHCARRKRRRWGHRPRGETHPSRATVAGAGRPFLDAVVRTSWIVTIKPLFALPNQTPGTTLCVRYRVVSTKGYGDWSQVLSIPVT
jgi:hypothetical protein